MYSRINDLCIKMQVNLLNLTAVAHFAGLSIPVYFLPVVLPTVFPTVFVAAPATLEAVLVTPPTAPVAVFAIFPTAPVAAPATFPTVFVRSPVIPPKLPVTSPKPLVRPSVTFPKPPTTLPTLPTTSPTPPSASPTLPTTPPTLPTTLFRPPRRDCIICGLLSRSRVLFRILATLSKRTTSRALACTPLIVKFTLSTDTVAPALSLTRFNTLASTESPTFRLFTSRVIKSTETFGTLRTTSGSPDIRLSNGIVVGIELDDLA